MKKIPLMIFTTVLLFSKEIPHGLSFQGFTGLVNTPNAQVMDEGDISVGFNNHFDNHLRNYDYSRPDSNAEDYIFGVGFFPNFELQGRIKEQPGYVRDLSANFKYKLPRLSDSKYFPDIAFGVQDLGSAANNYENYYVVADTSYWIFRASLGYGYSNVKEGRSERMDGVFGGLEAQLFPWFSLIGDYDGVEKHVAGRYYMPQEWLDDVKFDMTVAYNLDDEQTSFMFNVTLPLGKHDKYVLNSDDDIDTSTNSASPVLTTSNHNRMNTNDRSGLQELSHALAADGLLNITVGSRADTLYIAYENTVYLYNELDAIASVLKQAVKLSSRYRNFVIEPKHSNVVVTSISGSLTKAAAFYAHPSYQTKLAFQASLHKNNTRSGQWDYASIDANSGRFRPIFTLFPVLTQFVATEVSLFDYQLLLGTRAYVNLYSGLDLTLRYDLPIAYSDNLDPDTGVFGGSYSDGGMYSAMLNYSNAMGDGLNTISAGSYEFDYVGVMDQFIYNVDNSTFKLKLGYFQDYDNSDITKEVYLAKYSYHYTPLDLFAEIQGGKYWYQDTGFSVDLKRYFGDIAVELKYLQTTNSDDDFYQSDETNKYVGIAIEIPLSFRKSKLSNKHIQVNGDVWRYRLRSTVDRNDGTNSIVPNSGYDPVLEIESEKHFYNRNRLSVDYLKENAESILGE